MTCQVQQPAKEGRKVHTALGKTDLRMVWRQLTLIQLQLHRVVERVTVLCRNGRLCDKAGTGCPVHQERTANLFACDQTAPLTVAATAYTTIQLERQ